jgi:hypothetical protein
MSSLDMLRVTLSMSKDQGIGLGRRMAERVMDKAEGADPVLEVNAAFWPGLEIATS